MSYIKVVVPMKDHRLFMEMTGGSIVIIDISVKLHTMKYKELEDDALFRNVKTDGDYVAWGNNRVKVTAKELLEVVLFGEVTGLW